MPPDGGENITGMKRTRPFRLAALVSHPIQYQAPLLRQLQAHPDVRLHVYYCCRNGVDRFNDPQFGISVKWDIPLLDGYDHTFLRNLNWRSTPARFTGLINPGVIGEIASGRYDAVWLHGWAHVTNWMAWTAAVARRVPVLVRGEANGLTEPVGQRRLVKRAVLKTLFSRVAGFLVVGSRNADFYRAYSVPEQRLFHVPYTVDNDFFVARARELTPQAPKLRAKEGIALDKPVILFCGKFLEKKRPMDLLQAYCRMGEGSASLVFAGEGPLRQSMQEFITAHRLRHVHLLGFRNQSELPACYAMADVLVLPSDNEPWGLVVNEAMCFSLPVICSDKVGAAADLVQSGVNGFTYACGDVDDLAVKLKNLVSNAELRLRMREASLGIVSRWSIRESVAGVVNALNAVAVRT